MNTKHGSLSSRYFIMSERNSENFDFVEFYLQTFSQCNIGQHVNHTDRNGQMKLLICVEKIKGVPQWKFADGNCLSYQNCLAHSNYT